MIHSHEFGDHSPRTEARPTSLVSSGDLKHPEHDSSSVHSVRRAGSILRLALLAGVCVASLGCGTSEDATSDEPQTMVFVDVKTGEAKALPATAEVPVVNPDTGRRTMMPAMYCETCAKWYPVPPAEQLNRAKGAGMCPKHKTPLKAEGPMP